MSPFREMTKDELEEIQFKRAVADNPWDHPIVPGTYVIVIKGGEPIFTGRIESVRLNPEPAGRRSDHDYRYRVCDPDGVVRSYSQKSVLTFDGSALDRYRGQAERLSGEYLSRARRDSTRGPSKAWDQAVHHREVAQRIARAANLAGAGKSEWLR